VRAQSQLEGCGTVTLLDAPFLERLMSEFRRSMRGLLKDVCEDFKRNYAEASQSLELPIEWFRTIERALTPAEYGHWKVVGWIESLNDLLYFVDILVQVRQERFRRDIAEQLRTEFKEKFYEHGYAEELFPKGTPEPRLLLSRLNGLCLRLAREVTQESLCLAPRLACEWVAKGRSRQWIVPCDLNANFERVELPWVCAVGTAGLSYQAPPLVRRALKRLKGQAQFVIKDSGIDILVGGQASQMVEYDGQERWHWRRLEPFCLRDTGFGPLHLGPTLVYGKKKTAIAVHPTRPEIATRMQQALSIIGSAWPEEDRSLALLTTRIVPLKASGVVSFSYRHRPGLSVINCFDRDRLDLIDDLIHENSHHHLNLLLRKDVMYRNDHNQEIFYSPWRRSLRPLRGILHATFTFTMGAMLFERLSTWAETKQGRRQWKEAGLTQRDLRRARFRCLEEIDSVRYSLQDLDHAGSRLKWLTRMGKQVVGQLAEALTHIERHMLKHQTAVSRSSFGPALRRHRAELARARETFGLMRATPSSSQN
jgi:HEXXH motif-containing protein